MSQMSIPVPVNLEAIKVRKTLGAAITECIDLSGLEVKQLPFDKAQISRWESEGEGIKWEKLELPMDKCGNDAPLFWMAHRRGYDIESLRKVESELQKTIREQAEMIKSLRQALRAA